MNVAILALHRTYSSTESSFPLKSGRFWNYTMDYKNPTGYPLFSTDPEIGFGTHGTIVRNEIGAGGYQVDNGAFANFTVSCYPRSHRCFETV